MQSARAVPLLLSILVGLVVSLIAWGLVRYLRTGPNDRPMETRDDLLVGLLILAAFIMGACVTYFLSLGL
jgi:ABC-type amino acid transport system permease subunit